MKLVTFRHDGHVRHGRLLEDDTVLLPLGNGDLTTFLSGGDGAAAGPAFPLGDAELLAPLLRPGKLLAVAANHTEPLDRPRLFLKPPTTIAGPGADVPMPSAGREAMLAAVIGATARDVPAERALDIVGGYVTATEVSTRSTEFFDWLAGAWLDGGTPMGPWLVTADEVPDPQALDITLDVNGERRQSASTKDMVFSVAELVSFASTLMTLEPGDVLLTGTPSGVVEHLAPGDEMSVTIGELGTLTNRMAVR